VDGRRGCPRGVPRPVDPLTLPERARSCRNAITMCSVMVDEIRLRAHARPLDECAATATSEHRRLARVRSPCSYSMAEPMESTTTASPTSSSVRAVWRGLTLVKAIATSPVPGRRTPEIRAPPNPWTVRRPHRRSRPRCCRDGNTATTRPRWRESPKLHPRTKSGATRPEGPLPPGRVVAPRWRWCPVVGHNVPLPVPAEPRPARFIALVD